MQNRETKGRFGRLISRSKWGKTSSQDNESSQAVDNDYNDRRRAQIRYKEAANRLKEAIKIRKGSWGSFDFKELSGEPEGFDDSQFKNNINAALISHEKSIKDKNGWSKFTYAVECVFTAFSPFAKHFLIVAKDAQSIPVLNPYGVVCGGLLLLITIADKEIARKKEVMRTLDYLCQQLEQLDVASKLPDGVEQRDIIINRAIDVRTACMQYLASNIRHDATSFGAIGKVTKHIFRGDERIAVTTSLKSSVDSYNNALYYINLRIVIKMYELLKGMSDPKIQDDERQFPATESFIVPFERNPWFTGRKTFLETLKGQLVEETSKKHNHRVALYGMGGIGKTQTALEYVYTNKESYKRIYWITAIDQASLLSGYQKIAAKAGLKNLHNLNPVKTAEGVLSWLRQQQSWLVVIDNLDDINVVAGFLPQTGPHQHTLITTRNPNSAGIPAEGMEVPLLDTAKSVELLCTLSMIDNITNSAESVQAAQIVQELGYLPLGIEQAAAYVREVAGDFPTFLSDYKKNHKDAHEWIAPR